jgi:oligopeptide transport system substrate-binding protein
MNRNGALAWLTMAVILIAVALGSSYSQSIYVDKASQMKVKDYIVWGLQKGSVRSLSPSKAVTDDEFALLNNIREGLFRDRNGELEPIGVKKVEIGNRSKRFVIHLAESKWSNGKDVTAYDYVKSWRRLSKSAIDQADIFSFKALDKMTLEVNSNRPTDNLLQMLTHPSFFPQYYDGKLEDTYSADPDKTVMNGPYVISEFDASKGISLVRNPYYSGTAKRHIAKINIVFINRLEEGFSVFKSGKIDIVSGISKEDGDELLVSDPSFAIAPSNKMSICILSPNSPIFNDVGNRTAFRMAINRSSFEDGAGAGQEPAIVLLPYRTYRSSVMYTSNAQGIIRYNEISKIERANSYLRKSDSGRGIRVNILCKDVYEGVKYANALKLMWESNLNSAVEITAAGDAEYERLVASKRYDAVVTTVEWSYLNKRGLYGVVNGIKAMLGSGYANSDNVLIDTLQGLLNQENVIIPIMYESDYMMVNPKLKDWKVNGYAYVYFGDAYIVR